MLSLCNIQYILYHNFSNAFSLKRWVNSKGMGSQDLAGITGDAPCALIIALIVLAVQDHTSI